jgi:hypothetical protein
MSFLKNVENGKYNLVMFIMMIILFSRCLYSKPTVEKMTTDAEVEDAVKKVYNADISAIRTLSALATKIQAGGIDIAGKLNMKDAIIIDHNLTTHPDLTGKDGAIYRADGQLHIVADDLIHFKSSNKTEVPIKFNLTNGSITTTGPVVINSKDAQDKIKIHQNGDEKAPYLYYNNTNVLGVYNGPGNGWSISGTNGVANFSGLQINGSSGSLGQFLMSGPNGVTQWTSTSWLKIPAGKKEKASGGAKWTEGKVKIIFSSRLSYDSMIIPSYGKIKKKYWEGNGDDADNPTWINVYKNGSAIYEGPRVYPVNRGQEYSYFLSDLVKEHIYVKAGDQIEIVLFSTANTDDAYYVSWDNLYFMVLPIATTY